MGYLNAVNPKMHFKEDWARVRKWYENLREYGRILHEVTRQNLEKSFYLS